METPIFDFVRNYAKQNITRAHMPGHKGRKGIERYDITEITGSDVLYSDSTIIADSQRNAASLFGTATTLYSCEGSTLCIKAMLGVLVEKVEDRPPLILAARNTHKAFINACALLGIEVEWLYGESDNLCECKITSENLRGTLEEMTKKPDAVYITSPDYLGNIADIKALSTVCREYGIPLLIDNAHGAYLKFLKNSRHPMDLGAAMCADSAHKTLPVLTGGAYLHISKDYAGYSGAAVKKMRLFASTSPSYLILQSMDLCNTCLCEKYFENAVKMVAALKTFLVEKGFKLMGTEPLKITINCADFGYSGYEFADILRGKKIECEYADNRFIVLMLSPENTNSDFRRIKKALNSIHQKAPIIDKPLKALKGERVMSIRGAVLSAAESVDIENSVGRICAAPTVSCPPAIPIAVSGERITEQTVEALKQYGIEKIDVVKDA